MTGQNRSRWLKVGLAATLLVAAGYLLNYQVRHPLETPAMRGAALAERYGCFACHGPGGIRSVPAPGVKDGELPQWDQGMHMMYIEKEEDIAAWILDGRPRSRPAEEVPPGGADPAPAATEGILRWPDAKIPMPAYRRFLQRGELEDLIAFYKAVSWYDPAMPPAAQEGRKVAGEKGCFGCHGPSGMGGTLNPGAFKGYIPPWDGEDFDELVKDEEELRAWILEGKIPRFEASALARYFIARQQIKMPAYRNYLSEAELKSILTYIQYLRR